MRGPHVQVRLSNEKTSYRQIYLLSNLRGNHIFLCGITERRSLVTVCNIEKKVYPAPFMAFHDLAAGIEDTVVHGAGIQIDTAIVPMLFSVNFHGADSFL